MTISRTTYLSFFCSLTFCSLSENEITSDGVHELAGALQVNQSLQRLKWVKPFKFLSLRGLHWDFSVIPGPVLQTLPNTFDTIYTCTDNCMESHSWGPTQLSVTCHTVLQMTKSCLGMRLECVHLLHTKWWGLLNQLSSVVLWHSAASVGTRSQLKEHVHWLRLYKWTRAFKS